MKGQEPASIHLLVPRELLKYIHFDPRQEPMEMEAEPVKMLPLQSAMFAVLGQGLTNTTAAPLSLQAWVKYTGPAGRAVTYRLGLQVSWRCPAGSDPTECAMSPEDCAGKDDLSYQRYDLQRRNLH
eukprot:scaffold240869_cov16-Prasinocladus_malaysianus.AAC.2